MLPARTPSLPWSDSVLIREAALDDEGGDALVPFSLSTVANTRKWSAVSARLIQILRAVQDVAVAVPAGGGGQVGRVAADPRLGQPERGELLAAGLGDEVLLLLLLGGPLEEGQRVQTRCGR